MSFLITNSTSNIHHYETFNNREQDVSYLEIQEKELSSEEVQENSTFDSDSSNNEPKPILDLRNVKAKKMIPASEVDGTAALLNSEIQEVTQKVQKINVVSELNLSEEQPLAVLQPQVKNEFIHFNRKNKQILRSISRVISEIKEEYCQDRIPQIEEDIKTEARWYCPFTSKVILGVTSSIPFFFKKEYPAGSLMGLCVILCLFNFESTKEKREELLSIYKGFYLNKNKNVEIEKIKLNAKVRKIDKTIKDISSVEEKIKKVYSIFEEHKIFCAFSKLGALSICAFTFCASYFFTRTNDQPLTELNKRIGEATSGLVCVMTILAGLMGTMLALEESGIIIPKYEGKTKEEISREVWLEFISENEKLAKLHCELEKLKSQPTR